MSNHRGITITSLLGKVIEKLLQEDTDASILSTQNDLQFGFTKGLSPTMASLCLTEATTLRSIAGRTKGFRCSLTGKAQDQTPYGKSAKHNLVPGGQHI